FCLQAEDGIRCRNVTGVQTCALPLSSRLATLRTGDEDGSAEERGHDSHVQFGGSRDETAQDVRSGEQCGAGDRREGEQPAMVDEIGRASCRGRGELTEGVESSKRKQA